MILHRRSLRWVPVALVVAFLTAFVVGADAACGSLDGDDRDDDYFLCVSPASVRLSTSIVHVGYSRAILQADHATGSVAQCMAAEDMSRALRGCPSEGVLQPSPPPAASCPAGAQQAIDYLYLACDGKTIPTAGGQQEWEQAKASVKATVEGCGCAHGRLASAPALALLAAATAVTATALIS
jgi:hypothetical protein